MSRQLQRTFLGALLLALPVAGHATNGYFSHGYGIKSKGMAGVGIALPVDALAAATNPAGAAFVGSRIDAGVDWFRPSRESEIVGNGGIPPFGIPSLDGQYDANGTKNFLMPEFGYNRRIGDRLAAGVVVYGNGGMNTEYGRSPFSSMGGSSPAGVDMMQLFVAPTIAYRPTPDHAFGVSLNLAYQQFEARGLGPFGAFGLSSDATSLSNNGHDSSQGWGLRFGWIGKVSPALSLGVTYQTKTRMSRFKKYQGLFADGGDFDIPTNYGAGIAWRASPALTVAVDVQKIEYSGVGSVGNSIASLFAGRQLGSSDGPGFGWRDMTVVKIGASYDVRKDLTLRGGLSHGRQPIPAGETFFNTMAPGVIETHLSVGATWRLASGNELSVAYTHALSKSVKGSGSIPPNFGGGEANLKMNQNSLGVSYAWLF